MHCDAFILVLGHNVDEFLDYFVTWARAIRKLKVENPDSLSFKNACIVQTLVQSDDRVDADLFEDWKDRFWSLRRVLSRYGARWRCTR